MGFRQRRNGLQRPSLQLSSRDSFDVTAPVPNLLAINRTVVVTPPKTPPAPVSREDGTFFFEPQSQETIMEEETGDETDATDTSIPGRPTSTATSPPRSLSNRNTRRTSRRRSSAESGLMKNGSWFIEPYDQGNGGLKNAISAALDAHVIENRTWVGTLGIPTDQLSETTRAEIDVKLREDNDSLVVFCKDEDFEGHYAHYCKEVSSTLYPMPFSQTCF